MTKRAVVATVILDDPQLLLGVEIPQVDDAPLLGGVEERTVDGYMENGLSAVKFAKTHNFAVIPRIPFLGPSVVFLVLFYLPHLDVALGAAGDQHLLVGVDENGGAFCNHHTIDLTRMGPLADARAVDLEGLVGGRDQGFPLVLPPRRALPADACGVEEGLDAAVGVVGVVVRDATFGVAEVDPLYGGVLGADVDGVLLDGVCAGRDIADGVKPVDLVEACECVGTPHGDEGIAGAGDQDGSSWPVGRGGGGGRRAGGGGAGGGVGGRIGEVETQDVALVCLEALDELKGLERPDPDLSRLCPGEDVLVADSEGQDGLVVLELLNALGGVEEPRMVLGGACACAGGVVGGGGGEG